MKADRSIYRTAGNKCSTGVSCGIADTYFCKSRFNAFIFWRYDRYGIFIYLLKPDQEAGKPADCVDDPVRNCRIAALAIVLACVRR